MAKSKKEHSISWLNWPGYIGETWNPIVGCSKTSPGCDNCYAERMAFRLTMMGLKQYEAVSNTVTRSWNGETVFVESALEKPLHGKAPRCIFVCDMGDLFHESVELFELSHVFAITALAPQHKYLMLTKRPDIMEKQIKALRESSLVELAAHKILGYPEENPPIDKDFPNVGLGVTVTGPDELWKIDLLRTIPAAMRFVSIEPMLGKIILPEDYPTCEFCGTHFEPIEVDQGDYVETFCKRCHDIDPDAMSTVVWSHIGVDWVICGGESGPSARPMNPQWARKLRDQCQEAGVAFHFKQWGEYAPIHDLRVSEPGIKGKQWHTFDPDNSVCRVGKKKAGHLLDGKEYKEFPKW